MPDLIHIETLKIQSRLGVPEEERAHPQWVEVSVTLEPGVNFATLNDRVENTVDYALVCEEIQATAEARPRKLIETLAGDIAQHLLERFPIWRLTVEVRKFILPDTDYVAVRIERPL